MRRVFEEVRRTIKSFVFQVTMADHLINLYGPGVIVSQGINAGVDGEDNHGFTREWQVHKYTNTHKLHE